MPLNFGSVSVIGTLIGREIAQAATAANPPPMELELEKVHLTLTFTRTRTLP